MPSSSPCRARWRWRPAWSRSTLRIAVADSGPGIGQADRERLFSAFAQGAAGRQAGRGAGLGLSISARIVEAMGGAIALEATSAAGSTFVVTLPVELLGTLPSVDPAALLETPV